MMRSLLLLTFLLVVKISAAQKIPLINSGKVIESGKALYDSGKYDQAIKTFRTVPKRDTNYVYMLSELALTLQANKQYTEAIAACDEALKNPEGHQSHLLRTKAIALDKNGDFDKSVEVFQTAILRYPTDPSLLYNLGITYYNHKDIDKAKDCFFRVLSINPFHQGSHFNLGTISITEGRKTHAVFSLGMYLSINPEDNERLVILDKLLSNQLTDEGTLTSSDANGGEKMDQVLRAKLALEKNFKSKIPVDAPVVQQLEMFFDQLNIINTSTDDQWVNYYLPIYKTIREQNLVEPFMYNLLASVNNDNVKKWHKKNGEKSLASFYDVANKAMKQKREKVTVPSLGFAEPTPAWYSKSQRLEAIGVELPGEKRVGPWMYFYDNSQKSAEGKYDNNGKKIGTWKYYRKTGSIKSIENMDTGEITVYYEDESRNQHFFLKDNQTDGDVTLYFSCGVVKEKLTYKLGKRHGKGETYFVSGKIDERYEYADNELTGESLSYFESGQLFSKTHFKAGERHGPFEQYYTDGTLRIKGDYLDGKLSGVWKYYYNDKKLEKTGTYDKGNAVGEWTFYDVQGKLSEKRNFNTAGEYHGDNTVYSDGVLYYIRSMKNNIPVKFTYYGKDGKEIASYGSADGSFAAKTYHPYGQLAGEGQFKKGKREGLWKYYYPEGILKSEYVYVNDLLEGEAVVYFKTGDKKYIHHYKNDELHGYIQEFFINGKIQDQGWYQEGKRQQQWLSYTSSGEISSDEYYLNDEPTGEYYDYSYNSKLFSVSQYTYPGKIETVKNYNSRGEVSTKVREKGSKKIYESFYSSGKSQYKYQIQCGDYTGEITRWFPDGKIFYTYTLMSGRRHGSYQYNYPDNTVESAGEYVNGSKQGLWKSYYPSGQLEYVGKYTANKSDSLWTFYYEHGKVSSIIPQQGEDRHGIATYFSPDGTPMVEKLYSYDDVISYRVVNAQGAFGPWINFTPTCSIAAQYPNGNKAYEEHYKNGLLSGDRKFYFSSGKPYSEMQYDKGERQGAYKIYYPTGGVREAGVYEGGDLHGQVEWYNEDGSLLKQENYILGSKNGKTVLYKSGKKIKEITFWSGAPEE